MRNSTETGILNVETTNRNEWHTILKKQQPKDIKMLHSEWFEGLSHMFYF